MAEGINFREVGNDVGPIQITGDEGPQIRLLRCTHCKTLEELPDFRGRVEDDVYLEDLVMRHQRAHPFHDTPDAYLLRVNADMWSNPKYKKQIHKQIWGDLDPTKGFVPEYYASRDTFKEDAIKCHIKHNRQIPCIDWHNEGKRIGNPTKQGWKEGRVKVYLCDFCPVAIVVEAKKREQSGA